jgi:xyloglucan-specific exo-beta-1,4-glucanase
LLTTTYQNYSAPGSGAVSVHFINDSGGRDVQIDYVTIGNTIFEAEDQAINTGVWINNTCGGSNSDLLECNGFIEFTTSSGTQIVTSVEKEADEEPFNVYPNPVTDRITITLPDEMKAASIKVINASGKVIIREKASGASHTIDMVHVPAGFYLIRANDGPKNLTLKVIKR